MKNFKVHTQLVLLKSKRFAPWKHPRGPHTIVPILLAWVTSIFRYKIHCLCLFSLIRIEKKNCCFLFFLVMLLFEMGPVSPEFIDSPCGVGRVLKECTAMAMMVSFTAGGRRAVDGLFVMNNAVMGII